MNDRKASDKSGTYGIQLHYYGLWIGGIAVDILMFSSIVNALEASAQVLMHLPALSSPRHSTGRVKIKPLEVLGKDTEGTLIQFSSAYLFLKE